MIPFVVLFSLAILLSCGGNQSSTPEAMGTLILTVSLDPSEGKKPGSPIDAVREVEITIEAGNQAVLRTETWEWNETTQNATGILESLPVGAVTVRAKLLDKDDYQRAEGSKALTIEEGRTVEAHVQAIPSKPLIMSPEDGWSTNDVVVDVEGWTAPRSIGEVVLKVDDWSYPLVWRGPQFSAKVYVPSREERIRAETSGSDYHEIRVRSRALRRRMTVVLAWDATTGAELDLVVKNPSAEEVSEISPGPFHGSELVYASPDGYGLEVFQQSSHTSWTGGYGIQVRSIALPSGSTTAKVYVEYQDEQSHNRTQQFGPRSLASVDEVWDVTGIRIPEGSVYQLGAPEVSEATLSPEGLINDERYHPFFFSCRVTDPQGLGAIEEVVADWYIDGQLIDDRVIVAYDDGVSGGDEHANDGIFSQDFTARTGGASTDGTVWDIIVRAYDRDGNVSRPDTASIVVVDNHVDVLEEYEIDAEISGIAWWNGRLYSCGPGTVRMHGFGTGYPVEQEIDCPEVEDIAFLGGYLYTLREDRDNRVVVLQKRAADGDLALIDENAIEGIDYRTQMGMTSDGIRLWICGRDYDGEEAFVHRYELQGGTPTLISEMTDPSGKVPTGLVWTPLGLWVTTYLGNDIWMNASPSLPSSFEAFDYGLKAPYDWPNGMAWDGNDVWLCDMGGSDNDGSNEPRADIGKIMKISLPMQAIPTKTSPEKTGTGTAHRSDYGEILP